MEDIALMRQKLALLAGATDMVVFSNPVIAMLAKIVPGGVSTSRLLQSESDASIKRLLICASVILPLVLDDQVGMDNFDDTVAAEIADVRAILSAEHARQEAELSAQRAARRSKADVPGKNRKREKLSRSIST
jgi:hypothetical protein